MQEGVKKTEKVLMIFPAKWKSVVAVLWFIADSAGNS
jgi:hypothetical protein